MRLYQEAVLKKAKILHTHADPCLGKEHFQCQDSYHGGVIL
jgi:hypothetical protein